MLDKSAKQTAIRMPLWLVVTVLVAASAARADDTGVEAVVTYGALGVAAGLFDIGATIYDVAHFASGEPVPKVFGVVETAFALPQMAIAAYLFTSPPPADGARTLSAVWFVWATALAAHGIWTAARPADPVSRIAIGVRPIEEARTTTSAPVLWSVTGRF